MKKHFVKVGLTAVLSLALAGALAACGGGNQAEEVVTSPPPEVSDTTDSNNDATDTETSAATQGTPARDLGGRVIRWLNWGEENAFPPDSPEPDPNESNDFFTDMARWQHAQDLYRDWNFTIENIVVDFEEVMNVLTTSVLAGDPAADLVMLHTGWILTAITGGLIIPFNDFLPADHDIFTTQTHAWVTADVGGQAWTVRERMRPDDGHFLGVNMDIINAIGAPNPVELYERGEWTFDAFLEITQMATRSTTGDGRIDQFGISGVLADLVNNMIAANGGRLTTEDLNYGFDDPATMRALEAVYELLNVQRAWDFDPDGGYEIWDWWRNAFAFMEGNAAFFVAQIYMLPELEDRTFTYAAVPFPIGPDNRTGVTFMSGFTSGLAIPRGVQNPLDVFETWYEFNRWYGDDLEWVDEASMVWPMSRFMTEADGLRIMNNILNNRFVDPGMAVTVDGIGYSWISGTMGELFWRGTETPASIVEAERPVRQAMLDTVFSAIRDLS